MIEMSVKQSRIEKWHEQRNTDKVKYAEWVPK